MCKLLSCAQAFFPRKLALADFPKKRIGRSYLLSLCAFAAFTNAVNPEVGQCGRDVEGIELTVSENIQVKSADSRSSQRGVALLVQIPKHEGKVEKIHTPIVVHVERIQRIEMQIPGWSDSV